MCILYIGMYVTLQTNVIHTYVLKVCVSVYAERNGDIKD